ncbi:ABC transporter permease [Streptomyces thermolineatus]|uniref:ABC transporter permease n=1 Tax=Streptomyces thermolineatus TaxID=44033 RepID=A0ABN3LB27_9ACTN
MTGFVLLRARAHRSLLAVALLTVVLTSCVLAALGAYGDAVADAGVRRALGDRSASRALLEVDADVEGRDLEELDAAVRAAAQAAYGGLPVHVGSSTRSGPFELPGTSGARTPDDADGPGGDGGGAAAAGDDRPDLTRLATLDTSRVEMVSGRVPGRPSAGEDVPVAVPEAAARRLRVGPGDRVVLADRRGGPDLRIRVTGVYRPADRDALYWRLDPLGGRGVGFSVFTTYGPLLTDPSVFASGRVAPAERSWQARADFSTATAGHVDRLRAGAQEAVERLDGGKGGEGVQVATGLPGLLSEVERSLAASRSALLAGALQLVVLAGVALLLVAGVLAGERSAERTLLRARGASRRQLAAVAVGEALLLVAPAAAAAVVLAGPLVRLAGHGSPAMAGLRVAGPVSGTSWVLAAAAAGVCVGALVAPELRRRGAPADEGTARVRRPALNAAVRAGADVALLAVAAVTYWQASREVAEGGAPGADPLLVAVPACCLLAGAVLVVRLLPPAARLAGWSARRSRGPALARWQAARRPGRFAGVLLLGVLAVATITLSAGQGASRDRSLADRADFETGADLRVTGTTTPGLGQGGVYDKVPGIEALTPAARTQVALPGGRTATVLAMDTARAADVVRMRHDQADRPLRQLLEPLHPGRPRADAAEGFVLPDGARQLRITVRLEAEGADGRRVRGPAPESLTAVVQDRYGVPYTFAAGDLAADGRARVLRLDLSGAAGPFGTPAGPLRLTQLRASRPLPQEPEQRRLTVTALRAVTAEGGVEDVPVPPRARWAAEATVDDPDFRPSPGSGRAAAEAGTPVVGGAGTVLRAAYGTGAEPPGPAGLDRTLGTVTLRAVTGPKSTSAPGARPGREAELSAVATDAFLEATGTGVGGTAVLEIPGARLTVRVTGSVRSLPTAPTHGPDAAGGAVLLDLDAVNRALLARSAGGLRPGEWWLAAEPGAARSVAAVLRARPDGVSLLVRDERAHESATDPLGAGPRSALPAVATAAAALAAAGLAVAALGSLRERADEFTVLRALGVRHRRIRAAVAAEYGLLAAATVSAGVVLGTFLAHLLVPLTVLTDGAARPVPEAVVVLPPGLVAVLAAVVAVVPLIAAAAVGRRPDAAALREGAS